MKILHLSDTHGLHKNLRSLPEADVIVHSGDFTFAGSEEEAYDFMNWFCNLPYEHKVFIAGNHDMCMYGADPIEGLSPNVHYLYNSLMIILSSRNENKITNLDAVIVRQIIIHGILYGWQTGHVHP